MSSKLEISEQKEDLSKLGEFYSPINDFDYESGQISTEPNVQKKNINK